MSEHPWIKSYPAGLRWDLPLQQSPVFELLDNAAAKWGDRPALDFMGKKTTYAELQDLANRAAKGFQKLGVKPGVNVGLYLPNTPHYAICFFGILKAGGTVVNYSPLDAEKALEHKVDDSDTDIIVTLDVVTLYPQMKNLLSRTHLKKLVIGNIPDMTPDPAAMRGYLAHARQLSAVPADDAHVLFSDLLDNDGRYQPVAVNDPASTLAVLQYTGGTTGLPKGAMLTHGNLSTACHQIFATIDIEPRVLEEGKERILAVLPLFHIYALAVNLLLGVRIGAELILHMRFEIDAVVKDLAAKKVSIFPGVPTMYAALINYPDVASFDLRALRFCCSGGAPLPAEVDQAFQRLTNCRLVEGWGMTETCASGTFTPVFGKQNAGACGMPSVGVTIKFASVEDPTQYVACGQRGEICISGPNIMQGYWKNPQATAESLTTDGFFRTGDVGYMDQDGFVHIVDRIKDMILCGGYNVYPRIVEEAIYCHPSVAEVCVIGIHDEYRGQSPKAFIVLKKGAPELTLAQLKEFLKDRIGKHEMVQAMDVRAELPKTPVGKLSKKELYAEEEKQKELASVA
jgi:long-chain acyl-CoA synthetase